MYPDKQPASDCRSTVPTVTSRLPFLWGAQYYRAPTPEPECWETDLAHMKRLGFNTVKYWVQWRWSHKSDGRFDFDDLDRLMDMALANGLEVTINIIFDVAPTWLYDRYPDAKQVTSAGRTIEPYAVPWRQIGGTPGPCYNHPDALEERRKFLEATVEHFRGHPSLTMWDVWNEPEQALPSRTLQPGTLVCYCAHCRDQFIDWLEARYGAIENLNQRWGRCYEEWKQIELPLRGDLFADFIDWREFHLATMAREVEWRLETVRAHDPKSVRYMHIVPNTMELFNSVSCVDDFDMSRHCNVFAATTNGGPGPTIQLLSAARGKVCYNVESHINYGGTAMHQRILTRDEMLRDFLAQIGLGIKGFLFWQFRSEVLGAESPAWGLVKPNGTERPATQAAREFWDAIRPHTADLLNCAPRPAEVGIWKSRKNEIFHFGLHETLAPLIQSVNPYVEALYWNSVPCRFISEQMLENGELDGIRLLIMPACYCLTEAEASTLDRWVHSGGILLCEAHLGAYNASTGRHSRTVPGCGLAESWGFWEDDTTSSYHLESEEAEEFTGFVPDDVRKALLNFKTTGGRYFPIWMQAKSSMLCGAERYAILAGKGMSVEGSFRADEPCLISKQIGNGKVYYCGTNLGMGAEQDLNGFCEYLRKVLSVAGVTPTLDAQSSEVHVDLLEHDRLPRFLVLVNRSDRPQSVRLRIPGNWGGLFSGIHLAESSCAEIATPSNFADIFIPV